MSSFDIILSITIPSKALFPHQIAQHGITADAASDQHLPAYGNPTLIDKDEKFHWVISVWHHIRSKSIARPRVS